MPVTPELKAQILRYYHVEKWRTGTIARQLKVHHGTVDRALRQEGLPRVGSVRTSRIDAYLPFIVQTLKKFPDLRASRLYAMVKERGYKGAMDGDAALRRRLRHYVNPDLLVIDEIGYLSYSNRHADLLFELVNRRYESKSTIVTTNKAFADWGEVFPNAACVVSLVDRLVHHSEVIGIEGESYRLKEAQARSAETAVKRKKAKS